MFFVNSILAEQAVNFLGTAPTPEQLVNALALPQKSGVRARGINLNATPEPEPRTILDIKFKFDSDELTEIAKETLEAMNIAMEHKKISGNTFLIEGHTDVVETSEYNMELSARRAQIVAEYLGATSQNNSISLKTKSFGEEKLFDKDNPQSEKNRRVEVVNISEN